MPRKKHWFYSYVRDILIGITSATIILLMLNFYNWIYWFVTIGFLIASLFVYWFTWKLNLI